MPKSENQKLKLLYIKRYLEEYTDDNHPVTVKDIIAHLASLGVSAERKSIYDDLNLLMESDMLDIVKNRDGNITTYHVAGREFELPELKMLADTVAASGYLTDKKVDMLLSKLSGLCSKYEAKELKRSLYVPSRSRSQNENIFIILDEIAKAITQGKQLSFLYNKYDMEGRLQHIHDGKRYMVTPLLNILDDNYYLVAWDEDAGKIKHFRLDRMTSCRVEETDATAIPETKLDLEQYSNRHFNMFDGEEYDVTMVFDNRLVNTVFDRFGRDHTPLPYGEGRFKWTQRVAVCGQFYGWVASFEGGAKIVAPTEVVEEYRNFLNANLNANK